MEAVNTRVAVFDFDQTISAEEIGIWHSYSNMRHAFGGDKRLEYVKSLLQGLHANGILLAIVSYNSKKVICKALSIVDLASFFDSSMIFGRETWETKGRVGYWSKAEVVQEHLLEPTGILASELLFIDDDPSHCRDMLARFPEACVIPVPRPRLRSRTNELPVAGIQPEQVELIRKWAAGRPMNSPNSASDASKADNVVSCDSIV